MNTPNVIAANWNWSVPLPPENPAQRKPKGYQGVFYGRAPHYPMMPVSSGHLPVLVSAIPQTLNVAFDLEVTPTGQFNTLFDIDFLPTPSGDNSRQLELMIITDIVGSDSTRAGQPTVSIGGVEYWVSEGRVVPNPAFPSDPSSWFRGVQFVSKTRVLKGVIPIRPFVDYMLAQGWLQATDNLVDIDFGIEMNTGSNSATLRSYSITWK